MKIWISSNVIQSNMVKVSPIEKWEDIGVFISPQIDGPIVICRKHMARLLRGSGKRLPKHGSNEVVEVELTAK